MPTNNTFKRLIAAMALTLATGTADTTSKATGHWEGKIEITGHELSVAVDLAPGPTSTWIGSMSVVGSTAIDVPLRAIAIDAGIVRFKADLPGHTSFECRLSPDAASLSGTASNDEGSAPLQLARRGDANVKVPPASSPLPKEFEGLWEGALDAAGKVTQVGLRLTPTEQGTASALLIVERKMEIPVTTVTISGNHLNAESRAVSGAFTGTLDPAGALTGEWTQGKERLPLTFKRTKTP
jgi:hypothetical protein